MKPVLVLAAAALALASCAQTPSPSSTAAAPAPAPQAAADASMRDAQAELRRLGYYNGPIDGVRGAETAAAIERFQRTEGLAADGRLDGATLAALRAEPTPARAAAAPAAPPPRPISISDQTTVRTVQNRLKQLGYYDGPADGVWGPEMQQAVERFHRAKGLRGGGLTTASVAAMGLDPQSFPAGSGAAAALDPAVVRAVQTRLRGDGFYRGGVDGNWGPGTQAALERFQKDRGLDGAGQLTPPTIAALGLDPNNLVASAEAALGGVGSSTRR
jgi:peptidoglycan hydrolase-like protein with peptidoglycan-binding domain